MLERGTFPARFQWFGWPYNKIKHRTCSHFGLEKHPHLVIENLFVVMITLPLTEM